MTFQRGILGILLLLLIGLVAWMTWALQTDALQSQLRSERQHAKP
jgi:hypothetical protein